MKIRLVVLALMCLLINEIASGQNFPGRDKEFHKLAQSTMTFLNIDVGARAVGMGGAFTTVKNDITALFWNPAGAAKIKGGILSLNQAQWIADMNQLALAAAYGTNNLGTYGFTLVIMDNGSIQRTIPDPSQSRGFILDGTFGVDQWAAGFAYARQLTDKFGIGGQVKYVSQDLGQATIAKSAEDIAGTTVENKKSTLAFDFGTLYYFGFKDLRIGMSIRNFSRPIKYSFESFNLPVTFKIGLAMNVLSLSDKTEGSGLQLSVETIKPFDQSEKILVGGEYLMNDLLALRAGYRSNSDLSSFSAGFGIKQAVLGDINLIIDYAYSEVDDAFSTVHRFSFGFTF